MTRPVTFYAAAAWSGVISWMVFCICSIAVMAKVRPRKTGVIVGTCFAIVGSGLALFVVSFYAYVIHGLSEPYW